jgi:hypothetical protein
VSDQAGDIPDERRDDGYWLARCQGFAVIAPEGRIGTVEEVRYGASRRWDSPSTLAVLPDGAGRRILIVPVQDVAEVDSERQTVVLRETPHVVSTESGSDA